MFTSIPVYFLLQTVICSTTEAYFLHQVQDTSQEGQAGCTTAKALNIDRPLPLQMNGTDSFSGQAVRGNGNHSSPVRTIVLQVGIAKVQMHLAGLLQCPAWHGVRAGDFQRTSGQLGTADLQTDGPVAYSVCAGPTLVHQLESFSITILVVLDLGSHIWEYNQPLLISSVRVVEADCLLMMPPPLPHMPSSLLCPLIHSSLQWSAAP